MNKGAYMFALRRGWKDEVCKEMNPLLMTWTKEKCFEVIKTCKSKTEFSRNFGSAAQYAKRNGFYEELVAEMEIQGNLFNRMIYAYEFKDRHVYVGLTYKEAKRKNEHLDKQTEDTGDKVDDATLNETFHRRSHKCCTSVSEYHC